MIGLVNVRIWPLYDGSVRVSGYPTIPVVKTSSPATPDAPREQHCGVVIGSSYCLPATDSSKPNDTPRSRVPSSSTRVPCRNAIADDPKLEPTNASGRVTVEASSSICNSAILAQSAVADRVKGPGQTSQADKPASRHASIAISRPSDRARQTVEGRWVLRAAQCGGDARASPHTPGVNHRYVATSVGPEVHAGVIFPPPGRVTGRPCSPVGRWVAG